MPLAFIDIGFITIDFLDLLDVLVVGFLIYNVYKLIKDSLAVNIIVGYLLIYMMLQIALSLNMTASAFVLGMFVEAGIILLVIVFHQEIRRFLLYVGRSSGFGKERFWVSWFKRRDKQESKKRKEKLREEIVKAINNMSSSKTGALLVFTDTVEKRFFNNTGVPINGQISSKLIESVFAKNSPLHDGAMVIADKHILSAACVLPVSENPALPQRIGMRHKASVGISEHIDAEVLIVSEETGRISHAKNGKLKINITQNKLREILDHALDL
jgi:uncharacterized protein (TIGR00159 family)